MYRPLQRTLRLATCVALLGQWVGASHTLAATAPPPANPTAYVVQPEADQPASEIGRGFFTLGLKAGQTKTVRIVVKNTSKAVLKLSDYPADATQIPAGGIDFGTRGQSLKATGSMISVLPKELTLSPGESKRVSATFTVLAGTKPGDYVGGVAIENLAAQAPGSGSQMMIILHYRKVIAILNSVPGKVTSSSTIGKVRLTPMLNATQAAAYLAASSTNKPVLKGSRATVVVKNTGNVLWKGTGVLRIGGLKNSTSVPFTVGTILVHSKATITVQVPSLDLLPGSYDMSVTLQSAAKGKPLKWSGPVGLTLPVAASAATAVPNVALQPAHPAAAGTATALNQGRPVTTTSSSQSISLVLFGAGAVVLLILGVGLGVILSRRSAGRKPLPA